MNSFFNKPYIIYHHQKRRCINLIRQYQRIFGISFTEFIFLKNILQRQETGNDEIKTLADSTDLAA